MNSSDKSWAVITGASSGLGWEFAKQLAERNSHNLILVARRQDRLKKLAEEIKIAGFSNEVSVKACDLTSLEARENLIQEILSPGANGRPSQRIEWLINNAGFGSLGSFKNSDIKLEQDMVELNCKAPVHLCRAILPEMVAANCGTIVNVCSTAAFQAMPYMATYGATKSFLLSFSNALASELSNTGIRVLAHCPGPTDSEFHLVVGLEDKLSFLPAVSAGKVVAQALAAADSGRPIKINGCLNSALAQLNRMLPKMTSAALVERILRRPARSTQAARARLSSSK